jgi:cytochrome c
MNRVLLAGLLVVGLFAVAAKAVAAGSPEEVQALVERAAAYIREHGPQQAFADFSRPGGGFVDGELYVFCLDADGMVVAHGGNPKLVGKNLAAVRDPDGQLRTRTLLQIAQTKGRGWLEYPWPEVDEGRIGRKVTYVLRIDDHTICGSGYYKPDQP